MIVIVKSKGHTLKGEMAADEDAAEHFKGTVSSRVSLLKLPVMQCFYTALLILGNSALDNRPLLDEVSQSETHFSNY